MLQIEPKAEFSRLGSCIPLLSHWAYHQLHNSDVFQTFFSMSVLWRTCEGWTWTQGPNSLLLSMDIILLYLTSHSNFWESFPTEIYHLIYLLKLLASWYLRFAQYLIFSKKSVKEDWMKKMDLYVRPLSSLLMLIEIQDL